MKLTNFPKVEALVYARDHLLTLRDHGSISIKIGEHELLPDFIERIVPAVRIELSRCIKDIDDQLHQYGVRLV